MCMRWNGTTERSSALLLGVIGLAVRELKFYPQHVPGMHLTAPLCNAGLLDMFPPTFGRPCFPSSFPSSPPLSQALATAIFRSPSVISDFLVLLFG